MSDPDLVMAKEYAAVIAHEFTKRPMTLDEAADFAEVLEVSVAMELAADVVDVWNRIGERERRIVSPELVKALDALVSEDRS